MPKTEQEMFETFIAWANERPAIRALVLTSTRTVPGATTVDRLSDYDLSVAVDDATGIQPYFQSREWLEAFGNVLVLYQDPILPWFGGCPRPAYDEKFAY